MHKTEKLYNKSFTRSDLKKQLEGLQNFDAKNEYKVFEHDDFINLIEEIDAYYPEEEVRDETNGGTEPFKPALEDMTRKELKDYIVEKELSIVVKSSMSDDSIRELILEVESEQSSESEEDKEPEVVVDPSTAKKESKPVENKRVEKEYNDLPFDKEVKPAVVNDATAKKLADMRARMGKK